MVIASIILRQFLRQFNLLNTLNLSGMDHSETYSAETSLKISYNIEISKSQHPSGL